MINNSIFNYNHNVWDSRRELNLKNEQIIFEIKLFRREKREYLKKKYPMITEAKMLKKLNLAQKKEFGDNQKKLIVEFLSTFFF